jgi:hypothetical protein
VREVEENVTIEKAEFVYKRIFMGMEHNYLCAVCKENSGVQDCSKGIMQPCWECQKKGYVLVKINWLVKLFDKLGFIF